MNIKLFFKKMLCFIFGHIYEYKMGNVLEPYHCVRCDCCNKKNNMNEIIWKNRLDDKYDVFVERFAPYHGCLVIKNNESVLLKEEVSISYDALFGPDFADINKWENRCINFVDEHNKK